jgi:hypothetical protein
MPRIKDMFSLNYARLANRLPGRISGCLDWYLLPGLRDGFGGPFNGQSGRIEIFQQLLEQVGFSAIVETGTYRGTTTLFLRRASALPVYTIEAAPRLFHYAKRRFRCDDGIFSEIGDSRAFLQRLGTAQGLLHGCAFFYLDAHWGEDLPLYEELQTIARLWSDPVIMIDDFQVPDDPAYGFDDYGIGKALTVDLFPLELRQDFRLFWPTMQGQEESGLRRGCVVMAKRGLAANKIEMLSVLRESASD